MNNVKVKFSQYARYLGVILSNGFYPAAHIRSAGQKSRESFMKVTRLGGRHWGLNFRARLVLYKAIFVSIVTYGPSAWADRSSRGLPQIKLLGTQTAPLRFVASAYRTSSRMALFAIAGVEPIDLIAQSKAAIFHLKRNRSAVVAGKTLNAPEESTTAESEAVARRLVKAVVLDEWQRRWDESTTGRTTYNFFPRVAERLQKTWIRPDFYTTQFLTGHGDFRDYLRRFYLRDAGKCPCGSVGQSSEHILWDCPRLDSERAALFASLKLETGTIPTHADLVSSRANFGSFKLFCAAYAARDDVRPTPNGR